MRFLLNNRKKLYRILRFTANSDEGYKQLFIYNDPKLVRTIMRDEQSGRTLALHCVDWSQGAYHPHTYTLEDYDKLIASPKLFARKFSEEHMDVVEKICAYTQGKG